MATAVQLKITSPAVQLTPEPVKPVVASSILNVASLTSVIDPLVILINAVEVFAVGIDQANLVVVAGTVVEIVVQVLPLFNEYSTV